MPASLVRIDLVVEIAGRRFEERFACPCEPNSETTFSWDGKDASGRPLEGAQPMSTPIARTRTRDDVTLWKVWRGAPASGGVCLLSAGAFAWAADPWEREALAAEAGGDV
ncbi:hypothetical protein [Sorangium sp. So ce362]|uniref:hypothetical protein n=1 Tax=Sorangium sp. So ce362 TaxID=3133303 RepID=UPI003F63BDFD